MFEEKPNTNQHKHLIPSVKHCAIGLMIWACFVGTASEHFGQPS